LTDGIDSTSRRTIGLKEVLAHRCANPRVRTRGGDLALGAHARGRPREVFAGIEKAGTKSTSLLKTLIRTCWTCRIQEGYFSEGSHAQAVEPETGFSPRSSNGKRRRFRWC